MATCSTYFRTLFVGRNVAGATSGCMAHPIVYIPDLSDNVMEHLLSFMYKGQTTVPPDLLLPLIDAAKLLGIQGLMDPGNIRQLLDHDLDVESDDSLLRPKLNGDQPVDRKSVEEVISQEMEDKSQESAKPDSSNNVVFPRLPAVSGAVFPRLPAMPNPLALSLATSQLALGLDLSQHLRFQQGRRRKSSPTRATESKSPHLSPPSKTGGSSNMVNSSSGNMTPPAPHYPPTEDPTRPFGCTQCPKRFRMKHHLKEHMLIHSGEMPFSCHLCPKRFNRSYTLKNHMKLHSAGTIVDKFQPANV